MHCKWLPTTSENIIRLLLAISPFATEKFTTIDEQWSLQKKKKDTGLTTVFQTTGRKGKVENGSKLALQLMKDWGKTVSVRAVPR